MHLPDRPYLISLLVAFGVGLTNAGVTLVIRRFNQSRITRLTSIRNNVVVSRTPVRSLGNVLFTLILRSGVGSLFIAPILIVLYAGRFGLHHPPLFFMAASLISGVFAFIFKKRQLLAYGLTEIAFGTLSAGRIADGGGISNAVLTKWVTLVGAIYVVSRGCGNVWDFVHKKIPSETAVAKDKVREQNDKAFESQRYANREATPEYFSDADPAQHTSDVLRWVTGPNRRRYRGSRRKLPAAYVKEAFANVPEPSAVAFLDSRYARKNRDDFPSLST